MSDKPKRIQRKRVKGWKMPEGAMSATRPHQYGNPFTIGLWAKIGDGKTWFTHLVGVAAPGFVKVTSAAMSVDLFKMLRSRYPLSPAQIAELKGKDLACFCRLCEKHADGKPLGIECPDCPPCHVDVLLEIANAE